MKPAAVRRALRESEIWKSVKVIADASSGVAEMVRETCRGSGFKMESRVRVDKVFLCKWVKELMNAVTQVGESARDAWIQVSALLGLVSQ
jgi:hypothetical protein